jgi:hypothetical protein
MTIGAAVGHLFKVTCLIADEPYPRQDTLDCGNDLVTLQG